MRGPVARMIAPPSIATRFARIVEGLCGVVAARGGARSAPPVLPAPSVVLVWNWLRRLAAQFAAGVSRPARAPRAALLRSDTQAPSPRAPRSSEPRASGAGSPAPRVPRGVAWLIRLVPETVVYGSQLHHLLTDPAFAPLLEGRPALGRALRPLCRALGIDPGPARRARPVPPRRSSHPPLDVRPDAGQDARGALAALVPPFAVLARSPPAPA
jgi:hypothetical protein